jgi:hypothetical protein
MRASAITLVAALLSSAASASEPSVVWRSSATGVLAAPAPASEAPATPPAATLVVTYGANRSAWSTRESVLLMPDVSGGSGRYEYALASSSPLPPGLSFHSSTGVFSGRVQHTGDFSWSILVRDVTTGAMTTTVARIIVVT